MLWILAGLALLAFTVWPAARLMESLEADPHERDRFEQLLAPHHDELSRVRQNSVRDPLLWLGVILAIAIPFLAMQTVAELPPFTAAPSFALDLIATAIASLLVIAWAGRRTRRVRLHRIRELLNRHGHPTCLHCGYDLQGQTEPRCPECGRTD